MIKQGFGVFLAVAGFVAAQPVPGDYLVVLKSGPAAEISIHKHAGFALSDRDVIARKSQIAVEQSAIEAAIQVHGGTVRHRFDTLINAVDAAMSESAAAALRQDPRVKGIYPVLRHHVLMDQAAVVHRFNDAYQVLAHGASSAGAGVKVGILDCGVDVNHPAFQNFPTAMPQGFPRISGTATASNVNNKVVVARVYSDVFNGVDNTLTDALDYCDHGSTVAGIAAGQSTSPTFSGIGAIQGVAPAAWIGNYKVLDDNGAGDDTTFLMGLQDAFTDGMNVVNYSAGSPMYNYEDEDGPDAQAIATALAGGMVVVMAAGNSGPAIGSANTPAASAEGISVGAIENQRWFWFSANFGVQGKFAGFPSSAELGVVNGDTIGAVVDVSTLGSDPGGYACSSLPSNSLTNQIALIQRGGPNGAACTFTTKLDNALAAGAIGAIIYDNKSESLFDYSLSGDEYTGYQLGLSGSPVDASGNALIFGWSQGTATLPALFVSQSDGQTIQQLVAAHPGVAVDLDFDGKTAMPYPSNTITDFSSLGPTPLGNIKPDLVAVGDNLVAPVTTQSESTGCPTPYALDLNNGCYPAHSFLNSPFELDFVYGFGFGAYFDDAAGTSFATPMVTGSVAVLMGQIPGLSGAQYRSMVVNSAAELDLYATSAVAPPQTAGAGRLDLLNAVQSGLAASATSLNFATPAAPAGGGAVSSAQARPAIRAALHSRPGLFPGTVTEKLTVTNTGANADTFTATVDSIDGVAIPVLDTTTFHLAAGASQAILVSIPGALGLAAGQYHGFVLIHGTEGQSPLRIPYWYGVSGSSAQNLLVLYNPGVDPSNCADAIDFRSLDLIGLPYEPAANPTVTTTDAGAVVGSIYPVGDIAGTFEAQIVTGRPDAGGINSFTITVGNTTFPPVVIQIDNSGLTPCYSSSSVMGTSSARAVSVSKSRGIAGLARWMKGKKPGAIRAVVE